jgi:Cysteine rich repeat
MATSAVPWEGEPHLFERRAAVRAFIGRARGPVVLEPRRTSMRLPRLIVVGACLAGTWVVAQTTAKPDAGPPKAEAKPAEAKPAEAAPGAAAAAPAGVKADSPCKQDVEAFCAGVQPGGGRIYQCLNEHKDEISSTCKARLADLRATGGECKEDIEKFCAAVPHTKGMLAKCLTEHHDELSEGCKALSSRAKGTAGAAAKEGAAGATGAAAAPAGPPAAAPASAPAAPAAPADAGKK